MKSIRTAEQLMRENLIVKHYAGSIAYGTDLPTSDTDFRGVFCADPINVRTPFYTVREVTDQSEEDTKLYELSTFMKLCVDCNPNIIETLWVDPRHLVESSPAYDLLYENRHALLSSKVAFTTSGYALSQLKRIKGHNKWMNNPQTVEQPKHRDFVKLVQNFSKSKIMARDFKLSDYKNYGLVHYGSDIFGIVVDRNLPKVMMSDGEFNITARQNVPNEAGRAVPGLIFKYNVNEYRRAKEMHSQYWEWKNNRNEARNELEEQFGYDTKHAMHLVRLLRVGEEALRDGEINVYRKDAAELLEIRNGAWTYEEIVEYAEEKDELIRNELYNSTDLPKKPNVKLAAKLVMEVQDLIWNSK